MSPDVHTLTGAYALDAVDDVERRRFERHMLDCPDCGHEVDELRATAAVLGQAVAEQPPEPLRQRVLAEIARTRQDPPGVREPRRTQHWPLRLTAAAAVLSLLAAVGLGITAVHAQHQLGAARSQLSQVELHEAPVASVLAEPDARSVSGTATGGGNATALVSHRLNQAVLVVSGMPNPPSGRVYQVWVMGPHLPRSAGFEPGSAPLVVNGLAGAEQIGITVEPEGGSPEPTTNPIMTLTLPV